MVSTNGALETTYDIVNPDGSLILDGRMYLHQNDRFRSVTVAGTALAAGTYSFAQLNAAHPANFPATWTPQTGATNYTAGSGSITVGNAPTTVTLQYQLRSARSITGSKCNNDTHALEPIRAPRFDDRGAVRNDPKTTN